MKRYFHLGDGRDSLDVGHVIKSFVEDIPIQNLLFLEVLLDLFRLLFFELLIGFLEELLFELLLLVERF